MKLYDLIHNTPWETIKEKLLKLYPDQTKSQSNLNGFESAYNDMLKLTPVEYDKYIYVPRNRDVSLMLPNKRQRYDPMAMPWCEMLSMEIKSAKLIPAAEMAAILICEMTFLEFSEKTIHKQIAKLNKSRESSRLVRLYFEAVIGAGACGRNIIRKAKRRKLPDTLALYSSPVNAKKSNLQMMMLKEIKIVVGLGGDTGINEVKEILNCPYVSRPKIELYAVMPLLKEGMIRNAVAGEQLRELTTMVGNVTLFELDSYKNYYENKYHKPCSLLQTINATDRLICKKLSLLSDYEK